MKKMISLLLAVMMPLPLYLSSPSEAMPELHALSAVLMAEDGTLLAEREPDRMLPIASTTKLMTALVVLENCDLDESVDILPEYCGAEGSSLYLKPGERYAVRELLLGLLLASANDAAVALACHCAGDIDSFSLLMNRRAEKLGMRSSHFLNPHGLNEAGHYSTARDLAVLMFDAMGNEKFADLIGQGSAFVHGQTLVNHNKLLHRLPGCLGGKTGYTKAAGRCLVSCAERDGLRLVCVTLNDPDDWNDHVDLYDWAYTHYKMCVFDRSNTHFEVPLLGGVSMSAVAVPAHGLKLLLHYDSDPVIETTLPFYVFAPVASGSTAGMMYLRADAYDWIEVPLIYLEEYPLNG